MRKSLRKGGKKIRMGGKGVRKKLNVRLSDATRRMLETISAEEGVTLSRAVEMCVQWYYADTDVPRDMLLSRADAIGRSLAAMDRKTETFFKLMCSFMGYSMSLMPPIPREAEAARAALGAGTERFSRLVMSFRRQVLSGGDVPFMRQIWGAEKEDSDG